MRSNTGCDFLFDTFDAFLYDAEARQTYQQCYFLSLELADVMSVLTQLTMPVRTGTVLVPADTPDGVVGGYVVIVAGGDLEIAYRINMAPPGNDPAYIYCTGTGSITAAGTCKMNRCDHQTAHYAVVGAVAATGARCYHTCYQL